MIRIFIRLMRRQLRSIFISFKLLNHKNARKISRIMKMFILVLKKINMELKT